jgi:hypothetical protein
VVVFGLGPTPPNPQPPIPNPQSPIPIFIFENNIYSNNLNIIKKNKYYLKIILKFK